MYINVKRYTVQCAHVIVYPPVNKRTAVHMPKVRSTRLKTMAVGSFGNAFSGLTAPKESIWTHWVAQESYFIAITNRQIVMVCPTQQKRFFQNRSAVHMHMSNSKISNNHEITR